MLPNVEPDFALTTRIGSPETLTQANITPAPTALWKEIEQQCWHSPRTAYASALRVQATSDPRQRARAQLALIQALSALSDYRRVVELAPDGAAALEQCGDFESAARVWLEAALAQTWLGDLKLVKKYILRAQHEPVTARQAKQEISAWIWWVRGRMWREQGAYDRALVFLHRAHKFFDRGGDAFTAARLLREIGLVLIRRDPPNGIPTLEQSRTFFQTHDCPVQVAHCDLLIGEAHHDMEQYQAAATLYRRAQRAFRREGIDLFVGYCDLELAMTAEDTQRFPTARAAYGRAREHFLASGALGEVSTCDLDLGGLLVTWQRYEEALRILKPVLADARATKRAQKTAIALHMMGGALYGLGRYAEALHCLLEARSEYAKAPIQRRLAFVNHELGEVYLQLGNLPLALDALDTASEIAQREHLPLLYAMSELRRGRTLYALGQRKVGVETLEHAGALFQEMQLPLWVALCDRLVASTNLMSPRAARQRLTDARAVFAKHGLYADVVECDLALGARAQRTGELQTAKRYLLRARRMLAGTLPELAWRIEFALAEIAQREKHKARALRHYDRAVKTMAQMRRRLTLETLSNDFFGARAHAFERAFAVTVRRAPLHALRMLETAKAQTFRLSLPRRDWNANSPSKGTRQLERREQQLRQELDALWDKFALRAPSADALLASAGARTSQSLHAYAELKALGAKYEQVVEQLRLARQGLQGIPDLPPFSYAEFCKMAKARWGEDWTALDYYFGNGRLYIFVLAAQGIRCDSVVWGAYEQGLLDRAGSTHSDPRDMVYRQMLHGEPLTQPDLTLHELAERLIPRELREARGERTLIVSPYGLLHQLPFQALEVDGVPLLERFTFVYTPSLQALVELTRETKRHEPARHALLCGVERFANAEPLHHTRAEINALRGTLKPATVLWQAQASRARLVEWNAQGDLAHFDTLHFAAHTVVEPSAPHWSRILLARDALTVLDITELRLDARLVTLSACSSATGSGGSGDDWLGLSRAFFYAGARAVVASLWNVDDASTARLMKNFYEHLKAGESIAAALRAAQLALMRTGLSPYHWAAFVAMGSV